MPATRWKQAASATLEPPNLWTTQAERPEVLIEMWLKLLFNGEKPTNFTGLGTVMQGALEARGQ